jgi:hypothetical protein
MTRVISLEDYLIECAATWRELGDFAYHRNPGGLTKVEARRRKKEFSTQLVDIEVRRKEATQKYHDLVAAGTYYYYPLDSITSLACYLISEGDK